LTSNLNFFDAVFPPVVVGELLAGFAIAVSLQLTILPGLASRNFVVLAATSLLTTAPPGINSAPDTFGSQITAEHFVPRCAMSVA